MKIKHMAILSLTVMFISAFTIPKENNKTLLVFNKKTKASSWKILNDGVMGGVSSSSFIINDEGHGLFKGEVSTANNGGFASVRYKETVKTENHTSIKIRLKGDGKKYQFRVKKNSSDYESYITTFLTSGKWETISIKLTDLYPSFRGRKLDKPNFDALSFDEISILIANKKNESFKLLLEKFEIE